MGINATVNAYDKYAKIYDHDTIDFWRGFPKSMIERFTNNLAGKKVLDLGSGPGRDALLLEKKGLRVTCLDASKEMVKITEGLEFKSLFIDMRKMNLPENSFDGVWAYTSLLHLRNYEAQAVVEKIHDVLKPKGILFVGMIKGNFTGLVERESMPGVRRYFEFYTDMKLKKLVLPAGFELLYKGEYKRTKNTFINHIYRKI